MSKLVKSCTVRLAETVKSGTVLLVDFSKSAILYTILSLNTFRIHKLFVSLQTKPENTTDDEKNDFDERRFGCYYRNGTVDDTY